MAVLNKHLALRRIATPAVHAEQAHHADAIEHLVDLDFGPERFRKTAYRLRDGIDPVAELGLVATIGETLVGTLRFWDVKLDNGAKTLLLGPLAIDPNRQGQGIGRQLMTDGLDNARTLGWDAVLLVGDEPYYRRFGFTREMAKGLTLPGPVDINRFLGLEFTEGALLGATGRVNRIDA